MRIAVSSLVAERHGKRIRQLVPRARIVTPAGDAFPDEAQRAEIAYFSEDFWTVEENAPLRVPLFTLPAVRWFHTFSAGVDHPAFRALIERGVTVTNSAGTTNRPIAQYIIGMMLRAAKRMDVWAEAQRDRRWQNIETDELTGETAGIIGVGHIGGEVARLAKAFRMHVIGCRRRPRRPRYVDQLVPPERLPDLLAHARFVVLTVPLSSETRHLIGEAELRAMRSDAWLINVSRGRVVREEALLRALEERWIAGACLDVFEREPLPPESPLWDMPNAIITPHNSGRSPRNFERGTELFLENLQRYISGRPLRNRIHPRDLYADS